MTAPMDHSEQYLEDSVVAECVKQLLAIPTSHTKVLVPVLVTLLLTLLLSMFLGRQWKTVTAMYAGDHDGVPTA